MSLYNTEGHRKCYNDQFLLTMALKIAKIVWTPDGLTMIQDRNLRISFCREALPLCSLIVCNEFLRFSFAKSS